MPQLEENNNLILLVEDSADDRDLALTALQASEVEHEVVVCEDGEAALDYLFGTGRYAGRDVRRRPRVILLDIKLPGVNGLEVLKRLRSDRRTSLLPVVILTSSREERDLLDSYRHGANSYICKPTDFFEFLDTSSQMLRYWLGINEVPSAPPA